MFGRGRSERELDAELRGYVDLLTDEKIRAGMAPDLARRQALIEFGGIDRVKEEVRAARSGAFLDTLLQDVRYGARMLRRSPLFTAVAALTLAIGIGSSTAMITVVSGVLLRQLGIRDPSSVMAIAESNGDRGLRRPSATAASLAAWGRESASFESVAGYVPHNVVVTGRGEPQEVLANDLSRSFVALTGAGPVAGRAFGGDEFVGNDPGVVMLDERYWRAVLGSDPGVVGQTLIIDGRPRTIVGVMRTGWPAGSDVYLPMPDSLAGSANPARRVLVVGRLRDEVPREAAQAELQVIARRTHASDSLPTDNWGVDVVPLLDTVVGGVRRTMYVLLGTVACVLLMACASVAGLLLARAGARTHEMAVRSALGASRGRIMRQLFVEGLLLTIIGSGLGYLVAQWAVNLLRRAGPAGVPRLADIGVDLRVLAAGIAITTIVGVLVALMPAWRASTWQSRSLLRGGPRITTQGRASRSGLVVAELAFATLLLAGAALFAKSLVTQMNIPLGFDPSGILMLDIDIPSGRDGRPRLELFVREVEARLRERPGVEAVGTARAVPFESFGPTRQFSIEGRPPEPGGATPLAFYIAASPGYLTTLRAALLRGRDLRDSDNHADAPPVAVINETMARRYWGDVSPVGQRLRMLQGGVVEVVGVVGDIRQRQLREPVTPAMWVPWAHAPSPSLLIAIRTAGLDPSEMVHEAKEAVWSVDPLLPVEPRTMRAMYDETMGVARFNSWLVAGFAGVALVLAAMGVYGLVAYSVALQRREIGLRLALGARSGEVERRFVVQGLRLMGAGLAIGAVCVLAVTRLVGAALYEGADGGGGSVLVATGVLGGVVLLASWLPARRAARMPPGEILHSADSP